MRILITAGPTHEPIDLVRFIGNRSSGRMGAALVAAAISAGHEATVILGPVNLAIESAAKRIDVQTAQQMHEAVLREFASADLLIMAAAVADYRPKNFTGKKLGREGNLILELEPTADILAAASRAKGANQRTVGFSLEMAGNIERSLGKLREKSLDLIVYNPTETMHSDSIEATLLYPDGRRETPGRLSKHDFANLLIQRAVALF
jgi:phosphopantothenoylcysteine decarboxylase / phosphopantothenate---cysteine ligase